MKDQEKQDPYHPGAQGIVTEEGHPRINSKITISGWPTDGKLPVREDNGNYYLLTKDQFNLLDKSTKK